MSFLVQTPILFDRRGSLAVRYGSRARLSNVFENTDADPCEKRRPDAGLLLDSYGDQVNAENVGSNSAVLVPKKMMSPVLPCMFVNPDPCSSHMSHNFRNASVV